MEDIDVPKVWLDEEGIVHIGFPSQSTITRKSLESVYQQHIQITTDKRPVLVHAYTVQHYDNDAADYLWTDEVRSVTRACALIAKSFSSKHLAELFLTYHPPPYPFMIMDNQDAALQWLREYL